jgi:hypothetical protein
MACLYLFSPFSGFVIVFGAPVAAKLRYRSFSFKLRPAMLANPVYPDIGTHNFSIIFDISLPKCI